MEEKKPNEYTKDEIFNMSDEDFEKNFNAISEDKNAFTSFFQEEESNNKNNVKESKNESSNIGSNEGNVFDGNTEDVEGQNNKNIDNNQNFWNNFNSVNQDDTSSNIEEPKSSDNDTQSGDDNNVDEPSDNEFKNQQQVHKVRAYGQTMNFTTDELIKLAPKALHFTKKLQKLAPYRRTISAMEENNISEDDINQFIEMKKGNKNAISNFISKINIDAYDLPSSNSEEIAQYKPFKYGEEETSFSRIVDDLSENPKFPTLVKYVKSLDDVSRLRLDKNPEVLEVIMANIEHGHFDVIAPEANKRAFLDDNKKPMIEYYADVASEYYNYLNKKDSDKKQKIFSNDINKVRNKTKITGNTGIKTQQKQPKQINSAYDISDEELESFEKQMGFI